MAEDAPAIRQSDESTKDVLDVASLMARIRNDPESLQKLKRKFFEVYPSLIQGVRDASEQENSEKLVFNAHALKTMLSFLYAPRGYRAALELEVTAMSTDMKNISSKVIFLEAELERIADALTNVE
ncbi:MAG: hypothetical protein QF437_11110 [Planctomycetota bacterium]|jgi:HPt (histidine-containing phosphotransfer) domain-containing protein|nr:hypothetical protein [Planctomycetota bacterium]MDP7131031.1 hypothetical protein [Planctomycetota bacterium]MDP7248093.1 hypothetical protein [Planctomycetota bacterium]